MMISVILASYLGDYPHAATNRPMKFKRAVNSFINQTHKDKELIIVSDGCKETVDIYNNKYSNHNNIKLIELNKQTQYSGNMRNSAFDIANGEIITYLDSDDIFGKKHLQIINDNFNIDKNDWIYYDDYMILNDKFTKLKIRHVETRYGSIGTSSISHKNPKILKNGKHIKWSDGYGHDFIFVCKLNSLGLTFDKITTSPQYLVAHYKDADF